MTKLRAIGCNSFQIYVIQMGNAQPCIFLLMGRQDNRLVKIIIAPHQNGAMRLTTNIYVENRTSNPLDIVKLTYKLGTSLSLSIDYHFLYANRLRLLQEYPVNSYWHRPQIQTKVISISSQNYFLDRLSGRIYNPKFITTVNSSILPI